MKKKSAGPIALLAPDAQGWRLTLPGGETHSGATLDEAAATLLPAQPLHLALPCHAVLIERMVLPSADPEELAGMVELQLEKTLPYPVEDVSSAFEIVSREEDGGSAVAALAVNTGQLNSLCEPLRTRGCLPEKMTVSGQHAAAQCPHHETWLCLWPEEGQLAAAICEHGKLSFATSLPTVEADELFAELPAFMLNAEMAGVPVDFAGVRIDPAIGGWRDRLAEHFEKPVDVAAFDGALAETSVNLVPGSWGIERRNIERGARLKQRLQLAAAAYLLLVACAFMYLAWEKRQLRNLDREIAKTQPLVEFSAAQQARWKTLAPAIDPRRYLIELTYLLHKNRPSDALKFTSIEASPKGWTLKGQGPVDAALQFGERVRNEPELKSFTLQTPQPQFVGEEAQFTISGTPL